MASLVTLAADEEMDFTTLRKLLEVTDGTWRPPAQIGRSRLYLVDKTLWSANHEPISRSYAAVSIQPACGRLESIINSKRGKHETDHSG